MTKTGLNLGCGMLNMGDHLLNVDIRRTPLVDVVADLNCYPWPFASGWAEELYALDIVEHVDDAIHFAEECWRILAPHGLLYVRMPNWAHPSGQGFRAMDHQRQGHVESWDLFVPGTTYHAGYSYYTHARFDKVDFHPYGAELCWTLQKRAMDDGTWEAPHGRDA
jgi:SAM-dependent methyltransferase